MSVISDAVNLSLVSKVTGYKIGKLPQPTPQNLPQSVAIIGQANTANQGTLDPNGVTITSAQEAGLIWGFGCPIHRAVSILLPSSGGGLLGIPITIYAQPEAAGATESVFEVSPTGIATENATHTLVICGREGINGQFYNFTVNVGDTSDDITAKIETCVNAVLGAPVIATSNDYDAILTSKWKDKTSNEINISINTNGKDAGITYVFNQTSFGSGVPNIGPSLDLFGDKWHTIVVNCYGGESTILESLESFNGVPDPNNPTGRFGSIIMKPFFALFGFVGNQLNATTAYTDTKKLEVTNVACPAPNSKGLTCEAAANVANLLALQAQNSPHKDISGQYYPDMPIPSNGDIGPMGQYINRDQTVKMGCSTVEFSNERYKVCDLVTTYHPDGEVPPQFRYVRNLVIDLNVFYTYYLLEQLYVVDRVISVDSANVTADGVIKPKDWKQIVSSMFDDLERRALIVDTDFSKTSLIVGISETNPDRLETAFPYKRSSFGRISSTTAQAGFNLGN